tara:strand:+ start:279 stop:575 length:297 start_codon:yes stop_codon:yes gene_type:complete
MAKTKTKKEELVDLKPEKVTDEQLKRVQGIVNNINRAQMEIGMIESRKFNVLKGISVSQEQLNIMQKEFEKEYGTANIDITNGVINYPEENGEVNKKD